MAQFFLDCNVTFDRPKHKNLAVSISAMVCLVLTIVILCLLIFYRAYKTVLQRFFQYLTVVTLLHLLFIFIDDQIKFNYREGPAQQLLCKWLGFMRQWMFTMTYFFVFVITMYLIGKIYNKLTIRSSTVNIIHNRNIKPLILEVSVVVGVIVIPLAFIWVPFKYDEYSSDEQIVLVIVLRILMITVIITFIALSAIFCRFACYYHDTRRAHLKTILQTFLLMCFFVLSSIIDLAGLIMYGYSTVGDVDSSFWLAYGIAMPISQLIIPSGLLVYLYSFQWKTFKRASGEWKATCRSIITLWCSSKSLSELQRPGEDFIIQNQILSNDELEATAPSSSRVSPPSNTYFNVEYTGCFTNINDESVYMKANNIDYGIKQ